MSVELSDFKSNNYDVKILTLDEYFKMDAKEINEIFDNEFGIKISPGSNFMISMFNPNTTERTVYFDGAIPLHEFIYSIHIFCDEYIKRDNKDNIYIFSILKETTYINIATLNGYSLYEERKEGLRLFLKTVINIIERMIGLYMNENHKKKLSYRIDTTFKTFETSVNDYIKTVKPILLKYL
jgi:hypothetical protein